MKSTDLKSPGFLFCHSCFYMAHLYKLQHENILKDNFPFNERLYLFKLEDIKWLFYTCLCIPFFHLTVRASLWVFHNGTDTRNWIQLYQATSSTNWWKCIAGNCCKLILLHRMNEGNKFYPALNNGEDYP